MGSPEGGRGHRGQPRRRRGRGTVGIDAERARSGERALLYTAAFLGLVVMVPKTRLELVQAVARHPLKMVCLPIPPLRQEETRL